MRSILEYLNQNPGVGIMVAGIAALIPIGGWFLREKQKASYKNSPHIKAGGNITSGGHIIVGNSNVVSSSAAPEFHLQLYGSGAKKQLEGHIEKQGGPTLVAETIDINGHKTTLNQQFTKLFYLKDLDTPGDLFTTEVKSIVVKVTYRTLDDKKFEYLQEMKQEKRADNLFNVSLIGAPIIKAIDED